MKKYYGYKNNIEVNVFDTYEQLSEAAASFIAERMKANPNIILGLATGSSPVGMYDALTAKYEAGEIDFSAVRSFNLDEYYPLPPENDQSYRYFMNENLFDRVNIDKANTRVPNGMAKDVEAECADYDVAVAAAGGTDVQVLGIGGNGHIGFNEPAEAFTAGTHKVTLTENTIKANARFFASEADVPRYAVTMGMGCIMSAKSIVLVANGKAKAQAIADMLTGDVDPLCPASILQLHPEVHVFIDKEAASLLG